MMGISFTLMRFDDELKALVDLEAEGVGLTQLAHQHPSQRGFTWSNHGCTTFGTITNL